MSYEQEIDAKLATPTPNVQARKMVWHIQKAIENQKTKKSETTFKIDVGGKSGGMFILADIQFVWFNKDDQVSIVMKNGMMYVLQAYLETIEAARILGVERITPRFLQYKLISVSKISNKNKII